MAQSTQSLHSEAYRNVFAAKFTRILLLLGIFVLLLLWFRYFAKPKTS